MRSVLASAIPLLLAACAASQGGTSTTATARLGEPGRLPGVTITPTKLLEDSRCPTGVQCIQAGTVRVEATVAAAGSRSVRTFELGQTEAIGGLSARLTRVCPYPVHGQPIPKADYRFTFALADAAPPAGSEEC